MNGHVPIIVFAMSELLRLVDTILPGWEHHDLEIINQIFKLIGNRSIRPRHLEDHILTGVISFSEKTYVFMIFSKIKVLTFKRFSRLQFLFIFRARTATFYSPAYGRVTVERYYRLRHGIHLRWPGLPLIKINEGASLWPIELILLIN